MLAVVHLRWDSVDEAQWSRLRTRLDTRRLRPYGCLSWHVRRDGKQVRVTALWDDLQGARLFTGGTLHAAVRTAGVEAPEVRHEPVHGVHCSGRRPDPVAVPAAVPTAEVDALLPALHQREAA